MKDTLFYNKESTQYSDKRYPRVPESYTQFFFKRRLALTKSFLRDALLKTQEPITLLEVGCADGVVVREIEKEFPSKFKKLIGVDIAPAMIEEARKKNVFPHVEFFVRDAYRGEPVELIVEIGVINYAQFGEEMASAAQALTPGGQYVFSIAGTSSLINRLKPLKDFNDFRSYGEYDRLVRETFEVLRVRGCGFFVPYLWRVPVLARIVQSVVDPVMGFLTPAWCHEKLYLVKKK